MSEREENECAAMLVELAFLLPKGTNALEHSAGKQLIRYVDAVRESALHGSEAGPTREQVIQQAIADGHQRAYERLNLCPDHRDKATGRCIVCQAEERTRQEIRAKAGPQAARDVPEIPAGEKITLDEQYLHHLREAAYDWAIASREGAEPRNGRTAAVVLSRNVLCLIDEVRKLRAGSEAGVSARVLEWQDMSTAPTDGSRLIAWNGTHCVLVHWQRDFSDHWCLGAQHLSGTCYPGILTHWMPLPSPPVRAALGVSPAADPELQAWADWNRKPAAQARAGRCGAICQDGEPIICSRWRGHAGPHRGPSKGEFYRGNRMEWEDDPRTVVSRSGEQE